MTKTETIAALALAGYEPTSIGADTYAKLIDGFVVYVEDYAGRAYTWGVSIWCDETNDELTVGYFDALSDALAFPIAFIDAFAAEANN
jgi:hypothetical protein